jgi:hypothetical protein
VLFFFVSGFDLLVASKQALRVSSFLGRGRESKTLLKLQPPSFLSFVFIYDLYPKRGALILGVFIRTSNCAFDLVNCCQPSSNVGLVCAVGLVSFSCSFGTLFLPTDALPTCDNGPWPN